MIAKQFNYAFNGSAAYGQLQSESSLAYALWLGLSPPGLESEVLAALLKVIEVRSNTAKPFVVVLNNLVGSIRESHLHGYLWHQVHAQRACIARCP